jgi:hypothetical protein
MFDGNGVADARLGLQQSVLYESLSLADDSILLLDVFLRTSFHWNVEVCDLLSAR